MADSKTIKSIGDSNVPYPISTGDFSGSTPEVLKSEPMHISYAKKIHIGQRMLLVKELRRIRNNRNK